MGIRSGHPEKAEHREKKYEEKTKEYTLGKGATITGTGAVYVDGKGWTVRGKARYVAGWLDIDKVAGAKP